MSFTATLTAFGSTFDEVLVIVTEADLEYRMNDHSGGTEENRFSFQYKVYVSQAAKDAGGEALLNEREQSDADETIDITDGNIVALAETKAKALAKFSNIA